MRRKNTRPGDRPVKCKGIVSEGRERIGVEQRGATGPQHGERTGAGLFTGSGTRPDQERGVTVIVQQAAKIFRRRQRLDHNAGQRRRINGQSNRGHRDGRQPSAGARRSACRHSGGTGHRVAPRDERVATGIFVAVVMKLWQHRKPQARIILESVWGNLIKHRIRNTDLSDDHLAA